MPRSDPIIGLVVNPIAGMGGAVGLRGTDGSCLDRAIRLGATEVAGPRADRAVRRIAGAIPVARIVTAAGSMGASHSAGLSTRVVFDPDEPTTGTDTRRAVSAIMECGVAIILFAGGDGTARDVVAVTGEEVPVLGIPTGVKMHSSVFAATPEAAAEIAIRFLTDSESVPLARREVLDFEPEPGAAGGFAPTPFAVASVPYSPGRLQRAKATSRGDDEASLDAACREIAKQMPEGRLHIVGPGTTTARVMSHLGLEGSITGVDVVSDGKLVATDVNEREILELLASGRPATLILGVIGGQGFLLGRGNQQISPRVVAAIGEENVIIVAGENKLRSLDPPELLVDTGVESSEPVLLGYRRVSTGPGRSMMMRVVIVS